MCQWLVLSVFASLGGHELSECSSSHTLAVRSCEAVQSSESLGATATALMSLSCAAVAAVALSFGTGSLLVGLAARADAASHTLSSLSAPAEMRSLLLLQPNMTTTC